jgi:3-hydroxyisobutyrate dehydrogenase-like beta-hydroxyacid dehydrogenase
MAEAGQLICVIAGPSTAVEKMRPYTKGVMARENIEHADQPQRQATLLKIIGNSFILNMVEMLGEGHVVAEQSGLGVENLQQFIKAMFPAPYMAYSQRMNTGDYYNRESPLFAVDLALKDAGHMLDIAKTHGAKMKAIEVAQGHLQEVKKVKGERGDLAGIYGAVREESGMKFDS